MGIFAKVLILFMVAIGARLDLMVEGTTEGAFRTAIIFFYISNEGISILENASAIGLPIPKKLKDVLEQLRKEDDE